MNLLWDIGKSGCYWDNASRFLKDAGQCSPRQPSEPASSGGINQAPRDAPRGEAPRGIPRCEVDPDTRAANEVRGGNIGPSLEGKLEASSLFTKEVIRTITHPKVGKQAHLVTQVCVAQLIRWYAHVPTAQVRFSAVFLF